ncbi:hypothetical protein NFY03_12585 [Pseudomonas aeruginosa]|nr:hotdog domain-containing protein [Pseudomonas aeruginosa]MCM8836165.1 hypothetical protein [Pseudomonas aeruginosa]WGW72198.1 hotdog domain-containing protein [Pseudomonas aeruginosa]WGW78080.1 hotdog domain-containing protein [Pseudomonas aeruginosa]WGW83977.1 hotdog domain-containing protein [Pseudomonas aeruginosa]
MKRRPHRDERPRRVPAAVPPQPMVTVGLRLDFCGVARVGDWLEVHTRVDKLGQRMAFASARLHSGERLVASASGVFHLP